MGRVDGSGGIKAKFPVMPLPSEVTKPASYKDNNLSFTADAALQQKKEKKEKEKSMIIQFCWPAMLIWEQKRLLVGLSGWGGVV